MTNYYDRWPEASVTYDRGLVLEASYGLTRSGTRSRGLASHELPKEGVSFVGYSSLGKKQSRTAAHRLMCHQAFRDVFRRDMLRIDPY